MTALEAQDEAERRWPNRDAFSYAWDGKYFVGYWKSLFCSSEYSGATFEEAFKAADEEPSIPAHSVMGAEMLDPEQRNR